MVEPTTPPTIAPMSFPPPLSPTTAALTSITSPIKTSFI